MSKTYRFYVQSTFGLDADDLVLSAEYLDSAVDTGTATTESSNAVSARTSITDWSQYVEVTVQPARDGWVRFNMSLFKYSSGGQVFIDPALEMI